MESHSNFKSEKIFRRCKMTGVSAMFSPIMVLFFSSYRMLFVTYPRRSCLKLHNVSAPNPCFNPFIRILDFEVRSVVKHYIRFFRIVYDV